MDRLQRMQQELIGTYDELRNAKARLAEKLLSAQTRLSHLEQARLGGDAKDTLGASGESLADVKVPVEDVDVHALQLPAPEAINGVPVMQLSPTEDMNRVPVLQLSPAEDVNELMTRQLSPLEDMNAAPALPLAAIEEINEAMQCVEMDSKVSLADVQLPCPAPLEVTNCKLKDQAAVVIDAQEALELRAQLDLRDQRIKELEAALRDATLMRIQPEPETLARSPGNVDELSSTMPIDELSETVTLPTVQTPPLPLSEAPTAELPEESCTRQCSADEQTASSEAQLQELPPAELQPASAEDLHLDEVLNVSAALPPGPPPASPERSATRLEPTATAECSPASWGPIAPAPTTRSMCSAEELQPESARQSELSLCPTETYPAMPTTVIVHGTGESPTNSTAEQAVDSPVNSMVEQMQQAAEMSATDESSGIEGVLVLPVENISMREPIGASVEASVEVSMEAPASAASAGATSLCLSEIVECRTLSPTPRRKASVTPPLRKSSHENTDEEMVPAEETDVCMTEATMTTMNANEVAEFKTVEVRPADSSGIVTITDKTNGRAVLVRVGDGMQAGSMARANANCASSIPCSAESPVGPRQTPAATPPPLARASTSPARAHTSSAQLMNGAQAGKTQAGSAEISITSASEDDDTFGAARREARDVRREYSWSSSRSEVVKSLTSPPGPMGSNYTFTTSSGTPSITGSQLGTPLSLRYRSEAAHPRHQSFVIVRNGAQDGEQLENVATSGEARLRKRSPVVSASPVSGKRQLNPAPATATAPGSAAAAVSAAAGAAAAAVAALGAARSGEGGPVDVQQERARLLAAITGLRTAAEAAAHRAESAESRLAEEVFAAVLKVENQVQSTPVCTNGDLAAQGGMSDLEITHRLGSIVGSAVIKDHPNQEAASMEEGCGSGIDTENTRTPGGISGMSSQAHALGPAMNEIENAVSRVVREREHITGCVRRQYEELEEIVIKATSTPSPVRPRARTPTSAGSTSAAALAASVPVTNSAATGTSVLVQARPLLVAAPAPVPSNVAVAVAPATGPASPGSPPVLLQAALTPPVAIAPCAAAPPGSPWAPVPTVVAQVSAQLPGHPPRQRSASPIRFVQVGSVQAPLFIDSTTNTAPLFREGSVQAPFVRDASPIPPIVREVREASPLRRDFSPAARRRSPSRGRGVSPPRAAKIQPGSLLLNIGHVRTISPPRNAAPPPVSGPAHGSILRASSVSGLPAVPMQLSGVPSVCLSPGVPSSLAPSRGCSHTLPVALPAQQPMAGHSHTLPVAHQPAAAIRLASPATSEAADSQAGSGLLATPSASSSSRLALSGLQTSGGRGAGGRSFEPPPRVALTQLMRLTSQERSSVGVGGYMGLHGMSGRASSASSSNAASRQPTPGRQELEASDFSVRRSLPVVTCGPEDLHSDPRLEAMRIATNAVHSDPRVEAMRIATNAAMAAQRSQSVTLAAAGTPHIGPPSALPAALQVMASARTPPAALTPPAARIQGSLQVPMPMSVPSAPTRTISVAVTPPLPAGVSTLQASMHASKEPQPSEEGTRDSVETAAGFAGDGTQSSDATPCNGSARDEVYGICGSDMLQEI